MSVSKVVISRGIYCDKEQELLVAFDSNQVPVDLFEINLSRVGCIYAATVEKVLKDIDASILNLGGGIKAFVENKGLDNNEFIKYQSTKNPVSQGDKFYIVITEDKKGNKPYSCKQVTHEAGENAVCPDKDLRLTFINYYLNEILGKSDIEIITDIAELAMEDSRISFIQDNSISLWALYGFTGILDKLLNKNVYLENDSNLSIEYTDGLNVIDVNSGRSYGKATAFDTNMLAAKELSRQIRLRNMSGIIIVDMLKAVSDEDKTKIIEEIKYHTKEDYCQVRVHGFTRLGLLEITRSRRFAPVHELFKNYKQFS